MTTTRKTLLAALACVLPLAGCATGPYYGDGYYDRGYYGYGYENPYYYSPGYVAPSVGLGFAYTDRDHRDYRRREWRGDYRDRDRDGREWRDRRDYYNDNSPVDGQGNPRGHGGPGGGNPKDGGSPG
jgi:hypothetical protein